MHALDDWWHQKYTEDADGRLVKRPDAPGQPQPDDPALVAKVHLPSPSYYPFIAALGMPILGYGMVYKAWAVAIVGGIVTLSAIYAWAFEPSVEPGASHDDGHAEPHAAPDAPAELEPASVSADPVATAAEPVPAEDGGAS